EADANASSPANDIRARARLADGRDGQLTRTPAIAIAIACKIFMIGNVEASTCKAAPIKSKSDVASALSATTRVNASTS
ncbi:hypothetical protein, partial [Agrobacterium rosae]|uniref:hypothetical protein n=1 Tax=Agrobacterium rosae TaxID=1972867 RepID=UPI003BA34AFB